MIQKKDKKGNVIPKVFDLVYLLESVDMSANKSILPETASFSAKLIHHEERAKSSPEKSPTLLATWSQTYNNEMTPLPSR